MRSTLVFRKSLTNGTRKRITTSLSIIGSQGDFANQLSVNDLRLADVENCT